MKHIKHFNESNDDFIIDDKYNKSLAEKIQRQLERYFGVRRNNAVVVRSPMNLINFSLLVDHLDKEKLEVFYKELELFGLGRYVKFALTIQGAEEFLEDLKNNFINVEAEKYNL